MTHPFVFRGKASHLLQPTVLALALAALFAGAQPAGAAEMHLKIAIPKLGVAEYHRPYLAAWIERADQSVAANLAVWYDMRMKNQEGEKWLKDMRQWWRRSGRELQMPVDGVSGATRAPGEHKLNLGGGKGPVDTLAPGDYVLMVEAAREVGGRELVKVPFQWPPKAAGQASGQGGSELGAVSLEWTP